MHRKISHIISKEEHELIIQVNQLLSESILDLQMKLKDAEDKVRHLEQLLRYTPVIINGGSLGPETSED